MWPSCHASLDSAELILKRVSRGIQQRGQEFRAEGEEVGKGMQVDTQLPGSLQGRVSETLLKYTSGYVTHLLRTLQ